MTMHLTSDLLLQYIAYLICAYQMAAQLLESEANNNVNKNMCFDQTTDIANQKSNSPGLRPRAC